MPKDEHGNDVPDESGVTPGENEDQPASTDVPDESGVITDEATAGGEDKTSPEVKLEFKKLRDTARDAEDRAFEAEERNRRLEEAATAKQEPDEPEPITAKGVEPNYDDYEDVGQFHRDMAKWAMDSEKATRDEKDAAEKIATTEQERMANYNSGVEAAKEKHKDFVEIARRAGRYGDDDMVKMVMSSDNAHDVVYHLGSNPEEAKAIAAMSPVDRARALGRLEAKFGGETTAKPTGDPEQNEITNASAPAAELPGGGTDIEGGGETAAEFATKRRAKRASDRAGAVPIQEDSRAGRRARAVKTG